MIMARMVMITSSSSSPIPAFTEHHEKCSCIIADFRGRRERQIFAQRKIRRDSQWYRTALGEVRQRQVVFAERSKVSWTHPVGMKCL